MPTAIFSQQLSCRFGVICAIDDLTLEIPVGTVFGFLGPNGAGKTTMIRLLLGILTPTSGGAEVLGFDTRKQGGQIRERTGALLEHTGLYERLSAQENLEFYGRVWRMSKSERQKRIQELLEHLGLWGRHQERVGTWSRGMKQKLAVARALLHRPELIFLDEPTAGLDPVATAALHNDLSGLAKNEGVTLFLTTHHLAEAEKLCDLVGVVNKGQLLAVGHPDELRSQSGSARVEIIGQGFTEKVIQHLSRQTQIESVVQQNGRLLIDMKPGERVAPIISFLVKEDAQIEEVRKGQASLEEAFLKLVEEE